MRPLMVRKAIKLLRAQGIPQRQVARRLGVSKRMVQHLDKQPDFTEADELTEIHRVQRKARPKRPRLGPEEARRRRKLRKAERKKTRRLTHGLYVQYLKESKPCADCNISYPAYVMDFDHVRGVKYRNVSQILHLPLERILQEIEKCDLVCSNCHRIRTVNRRLVKT